MLQSHSYCLTFSALIREHWNELQVFTATQRFARNQAIFSVGDPADAMCLIESGRVKVSQLSADGKEQIVAIYQTGDLFGEVCICKKGVREQQAVALEPLSLVSFRVKELLKLLQNKPEMVFNLLMLFCTRVAECQERAASLAFDEVRERLVKEMLRLSGLPTGAPASGGVRLPVRLTHEELANLANTTRENVTKIMNEFREDGLLDYGREGIVLFPDRMKAYLRKQGA